MDVFVLYRVAAALQGQLSQTTVRDLIPEGSTRLRIVFGAEDGSARSLAIALDPRRAWIGRPARPSRPGVGDPFLASAARALRGCRLDTVRTTIGDRRLALGFVTGECLVVELGPPPGNVVLLDGAGRVAGWWRRSKAAQSRLRVGDPYSPPPAPPGLDLSGADPQTINFAIEAQSAIGIPPERAVRRAIAGLSRDTVGAVLEEVAATGDSVGEILSRHVELVIGGEDDVWVEALVSPEESLRGSGFSSESSRLLAWRPALPQAGAILWSSGDAARTIGIYHEALVLHETAEARGRGLRGLVDREIRRTVAGSARAREDLVRFADPELHRRHGEALLAGLTQARRAGDHVFVPDPYDAEGALVSVPAAPDERLDRAADRCFERYRRARRGLDRAQARDEECAARAARLEAIASRIPEVLDPNACAALEAALRTEGLAVGLAPRRGPQAAAGPRVEGVRVLRGDEGVEIWIGKEARENDRLTFRLARPQDFWFHAQGVPGAHVVLRNDAGRPRPAPRALTQAAEAAAWFSDARGQAWVDVQWTQRKNVRRIRGAKPGVVSLKRHEVIRVRPAQPSAGGVTD